MKYQISMAPMEGLTGYVYRRAHHAYFAPLDTYYTPFISNKKLGSRERHEINLLLTFIQIQQDE